MPKISALTSLAQADVVTTTDVLPIVDATAPATTKKVTVQAMVNAGLATLTTLPSGIVNASLNSITPTGGTLAVTGQASFAAGTAAAPSVKVGGEQNGLYSDGAGSLSFATAGARVVRMGTVGGTGNYLRLDANNTPTVTAIASATNADIGIASAGTGSVLFATNGSIATTQVRVSHAASAVNYWDFTGGTGSGIRVDTAGSDSGVNGFFVAKGSGVWSFCTSGSSGNRQFQIGHIASAVNYLQVTGAATGDAVTISGAGSDANIDFAITPKGTGVLRFGTHSALAAETVTGYITIKDSAGNTRKLAVVS